MNNVNIHYCIVCQRLDLPEEHNFDWDFTQCKQCKEFYCNGCGNPNAYKCKFCITGTKRKKPPSTALKRIAKIRKECSIPKITISVYNFEHCTECNDYTIRHLCCDCDQDRCSKCYGTKDKNICRECIRKCEECENFDYEDGEPNFYTCDFCDMFLCNECSGENLMMAETTYSRYPYYPYDHKTVCDECVDDAQEKGWLTEEDLDEQREIDQQEIDEREVELGLALENSGLELRDDSRYCQKYIREDEGDIDEIVERMCQVKFLFDYTEFKKVKDNRAKNGFYRGLFEESEDIIMKNKSYPKQGEFPWQKLKFVVIKEAVEDWIWKPICCDCTIGIRPRLDMEFLCIEN